MVKRASAPAAASSLRSSAVLSRAVEKNFALEAEVSRLRHHVSILSQRLHRNEKELAALRAPKSAPTPTDPPSSPASAVVTVLGGGLDPESPRTFGGLAEELGRGEVAPTVIPSSPPPFEVVVGVGGPVSNFGSHWIQAAPSDSGGVEENPVAVSAAVAPLQSRWLSLLWLSPWLIGKRLPFGVAPMRLLETLVARLPLLLCGPHRVRGGRARSVGSNTTLPTWCCSSQSLMAP